MAHRSLLPQAVDDYLRTVVARESPLQQRLRDETSKLPMGGMQIGADQGVFLAFLVRLIGARNAIEIGTFTGYSALSVATRPCARRPSRLLRRERGVDGDRAPLLGRGRASPIASSSICGRRRRRSRSSSASTAPGSFDFAFIDADKTGYDAYYEACLELLRAGGLIAIDNVLWSGTVADPADQKPDTVALRALTVKIRDDPRVDACLVSLGDGVMLARKL